MNRIRGTLSSRWVLIPAALACLTGLAFAALSLVSPTATILVQLQAFTGYAVLATLLGLLALPGTARHGWKPVLAVGTAIILSLALLSPPLIASHFGSTPQAREGAESLTVMSLNMRLGLADPDSILKHASNVDVLALSEITPEGLEGLEQAGLSRMFKFRGGRADPEAEGTMIFAHEELQADLIEGLAFSNYVVRVGGVKLIVAHPAAPVDDLDWAGDHEKLREAIVKEKPALLIGDLNANAYHRPLEELNELSYRDASEMLNLGGAHTWPANGLYPLLGLLPPTVALDHAFLSSGWAAVEEDVFTVPHTDHLAIVVTIAPRAVER